MKGMDAKKLAVWLAALSLVCSTALAVHVPGIGAAGAASSASAEAREAALTEDAALTEKPGEKAGLRRDPAPSEEAELMDVAGNVQLEPCDGGYAVTGCDASVTAAVIPARYQDKPVVQIKKNAFNGRSNLVSVVIPDTVQTIGAYAFYNCYNLSSFTFPASAVFQDNNNGCCRDTVALSVHITKGTGTMPDYSGFYNWTPWYSASYYGHPVTVEIDDGVKNIGNQAFRACGSLTTARVGADVAAVGHYAFSGCEKLEAAPFISQLDSIGDKAFENCKLIPEAIVKPGVTAIPVSAFQDCHSLKTVVLPDSVETIGAYAFYNCYNLSSFTLPASAVFQENNNGCCRDTAALSVHITKGTGTMPDYSDFYGWTPWYSASYNGHPVTVVIDKGVKNIGDQVFRACGNLTTAQVGADVSAVGHYAFSGCEKLEAAPFISQLDSIGDKAFENCALIPEAIVKPGVTAIPESAFQNCHSLKTVVLPDSVKTIGAYAFYNCYNLSSFTLPASAVFQQNNNGCCRDVEALSVHITKGTGTMPDYADFYGWTPWYSASYNGHPVTVVIDEGVKNIGDQAFRACGSLTTAQVGADVSAVGHYAFSGCEQLEAAPFISQLDSIGDNAFENCKLIPEAIVKPGVTAIPVSAFQNCHSLKTVVLPDSVETIGAYAFYNCYNLSSFTLPASAVFQQNNNGCCRDVEALSVHITKGTGTMPDYSDFYGWTPWYSASWYKHPVTVEIDEGVKNMGAHAFRACANLASVAIPSTLTLVGYYATDECKSLGQVYYSGTAEQWKNVTIQEHNVISNIGDNVEYARGILVSVTDGAGKTLGSMAFHDLTDCTVVCTLYDARGRMISADLKSYSEAAFAASDGAVRVRILFLSGNGLVPVRSAETLWLQNA